MRAWIFAAASAALLVSSCAPIEPPPSPLSYAAVVADPARPAADRERDALRKPAEILAFAEVRPGLTVLDAMPGGGYFTRLFARTVGPMGKVYAYVPSEVANQFDSKKSADALAAAYENVESVSDPLIQRASEPIAAIVFTAQNYHDFRLDYFNRPDMAQVNAAIWSVLRPGGLYVIIDHSAAPGTGARDAGTLHRIDKELVRQEVTAAGFVFEGESTVLANPADPRTASVFDPSIRGRTDQFALKFRKPRT